MKWSALPCAGFGVGSDRLLSPAAMGIISNRHRRQIYYERRPFPDLGVHAQRPIGPFHQSLHDVQSEAGAASLPFRAEIWLENLRQCFSWNSRSVVAYR